MYIYLFRIKYYNIYSELIIVNSLYVYNVIIHVSLIGLIHNRKI